MKVWENSKKLWKHSPAARVLTAFLVIPNSHSCFLFLLFKNTLSIYMYCVIIWVKVVLKRTVVGARCFITESWSHQSLPVNGVLSLVYWNWLLCTNLKICCKIVNSLSIQELENNNNNNKNKLSGITFVIKPLYTRITSKIQECKNTFTAMASYR